MKTIDRTNDRLITIPAALGVEGAVDKQQRQRVREVSDDDGITWRLQCVENIGEPTGIEQDITAAHPDLAITPEDDGFAIGDTWCPTYEQAALHQRRASDARKADERSRYDEAN